jgi:predicted ferric reductase
VLQGGEVTAVIITVTALVLASWARHGGLADLAKGWSLTWTSLTRLSGLGASATALAGLLLVARPRSLERRYGMDRLFNWHRVIGEVVAVLVAVHVATALAAVMPGDGGWWPALRDLTGQEPYLAGATVGALLIVIVTLSSVRIVRRQLAYETWYFVHLTAYLGLALAFGHQIYLGGDFANDAFARWMWIALNLAVLLALVWGRWGRLLLSASRPLRVEAIERQTDGVVSVVLAGRNLRHIEASAGQFFLLRPLHPGLWWQAHPFSLSAAPSTRGLRFTVKDLGDASQAVGRLPIGAHVAVEGPYGICTPEVLDGCKPLFIAGGVGVAPVRAMLERLSAGSQPVVLYRASREGDLVHLDELRHLAERTGGSVLTLVGRTKALAVRDPFSALQLRQAVPDLDDREAVLCGPEALLYAARRGLLAAGVGPEHIHYERPWW